MDTPNTHDRAREHAQLRKCEQGRRDPQYREYFWEGGERWQRSLERLIQRENTSDHIYQYQIDEARLDSEVQLALEEQHFNAVDEDVKWYERFLNDLRQVEQQWCADKSASREDLKELADHRFLIKERMLEREVRYHELKLEMLERRRRRRGGLKQGSWAKRWQDLRAAFHEQDELYRRRHGVLKQGSWAKRWQDLRAAFHEQDKLYRWAYGKGIPDALYTHRLAWCEQLRRVQGQTHRSWGGDKKADQRGLRDDMKQVEAMIASLSFRRSMLEGARAYIASGAVVVVLCLVVLFLTRGNTVTQSASSSMPRPAIRITPTRASGALSPGDAFASNERGKELLAQGDCDQAIRQFQEAVKADPSFYEPFDNMAFCLYEQGKVEDAITQWRRALAIYPDSPDANAGLGMALYTTGNYAEGLKFYSIAIDNNPGYRDETWLRTTALWSTRAIADSRSLRTALLP